MKLPADLEYLKLKQASEYRDRDFNVNPNGYTVAPYVNEETTSDAYESGFDSGALEVKRMAELMERACEQALRQWHMYITEAGQDDIENIHHAEAREWKQCNQALSDWQSMWPKEKE